MPAKKTAKKAAPVAPVEEPQIPATDPLDVEVAHSPTPEPEPEPEPVKPPIPPANGRGVLRWVKNLHRSFGPEAHYATGTLCDDVGNEFQVLLTETELHTIRTRAAGVLPDIACAPPLVD